MSDKIKLTREKLNHLSKAELVDELIGALTVVVSNRVRIEQLEAQRIDCIADLGVMEARATLAEAQLKMVREAAVDDCVRTLNAHGFHKAAATIIGHRHSATTGAKTP